MSLTSVTIEDLKRFVGVYQPDAVLRDKAGMNVRVGNHIAPKGGPGVVHQLKSIVDAASIDRHPYDTHHKYETLHPFTDGNGRSGRMLFAWMMNRQGNPALHHIGFLHAWYYMSLERNVNRTKVSNRAPEKCQTD